jgi:S-adenosylmethionine synthetase
MHTFKTYTVESVTAGHPDKVCDQVSDAILDACIAEDPMTRAGIETFGSHGVFMIGGEVTTKADVNFEEVARRVYKEIGYDHELGIVMGVSKQSPDIAQGVDTGGAGDQGIMYGYATNDTPEYLPFAIVKVHALAKKLEELRRRGGDFSWLRPDGKTQITVLNDRVTTVLVSCQHDEKIAQPEIALSLRTNLIAPVMGDIGSIEILVNPTGKFVQGGFEADAGLTGRKIMVDTYCGLAPHGGGCFSGKDPTKVDRSAAYMARFVAKNVVANKLASKCLVSVAYAIGRAEPLMVEVLNENDESLWDKIKTKFDFRPGAIIERLGLRKPIYRQTAAYGHFGKAGLPWEEVVSL